MGGVIMLKVARILDISVKNPNLDEYEHMVWVPCNVTAFDLVRKTIFLMQGKDRTEFLVEQVDIENNTVYRSKVLYTVICRGDMTLRLFNKEILDDEDWWGTYIEDIHGFEIHPRNAYIHKYLNKQTILYRSDKVWINRLGSTYINVSGSWENVTNRKDDSVIPRALLEEIEMFKNFHKS
jgi:hypothetical protein